MIFLLIFFAIILIPVGLIFGIAWYLADSRKKKQQKIINTLPKETNYTVAVRINSERSNNEVIKLKAFQYSGILYLKNDDYIYFRGTNGDNIRFSLRNSSIRFEGVQIQNGALQWFSINDPEQGKYFFNIETGMFIFNTKKNAPTTQSTCNFLLAEQKRILNN